MSTAAYCGTLVAIVVLRGLWDAARRASVNARMQDGKQWFSHSHPLFKIRTKLAGKVDLYHLVGRTRLNDYLLMGSFWPEAALKTDQFSLI